jgi:hypothetical protein
MTYRQQSRRTQNAASLGCLLFVIVFFVGVGVGMLID